jgi:integrase
MSVSTMAPLRRSTNKAKESLFSNHLLPRLGKKRLDRITDEDVQDIKAALATRNRKTVNNVLALLHHTLRIALKWKVITAIPCSIELYKVSNVVPGFYEVEQYARLVEAAEKIDARTLVAILLGGDAGLRRGEIVALRQTDVDLRRRQLRIELSDWRGILDTPKRRARSYLRRRLSRTRARST